MSDSDMPPEEVPPQEPDDDYDDDDDYSSPPLEEEASAPPRDEDASDDIGQNNDNDDYYDDDDDDDGGQRRYSDRTDSTWEDIPKINRLFSYAPSDGILHRRTSVDLADSNQDSDEPVSPEPRELTEEEKRMEELKEEERKRLELEAEFEAEVIMESVLRWAEPYEMGVLRCQSHGKQKVDEISKLLSVFNDDDDDDDYWAMPPFTHPTAPIDLDKTTPFGYLVATGMIPVLKKLIKLMAEKRPRCAFMNTDQCAALYMGYHLKTLNMNCPYERRQKYRNAMFNLTTTRNTMNTFLTELQNYYGLPMSKLPERLRKQFEDFLIFENLPIEEKVLFPKIPGESLGYDEIPNPYSDPQITRKVIGIVDQLKMVDLVHKWGAFEIYCYKKQLAAEAAEQAADNAREAAEFIEKVNKKRQMKKDAKAKHLASYSYQSSR